MLQHSSEILMSPIVGRVSKKKASLAWLLLWAVLISSPVSSWPLAKVIGKDGGETEAESDEEEEKEKDERKKRYHPQPSTRANPKKKGMPTFPCPEASRRLRIYDFIGTNDDVVHKDLSVGTFSPSVRPHGTWGCLCDLDKQAEIVRKKGRRDEIAVVFLHGHGRMHGENQMVKKGNCCQNCPEYFPLAAVVSLFDDLGQSILLIPYICRRFSFEYENPKDKRPEDFPRLSTRRVAVISPTSPGHYLWERSIKDPTRQLILEVLAWFEDIRDALRYLHRHKGMKAKTQKRAPLDVDVDDFWENKMAPVESAVADEDELAEEVQKLGLGHPKPYVKSAPLPKDDKGPLRSLVASNFAKVALDENKDALIEFYAPWCGHCKSFEPKYKQLAAALAKTEPNLVLAKFDATANEAPEGFDVEGFPTIYFAPAGQKDKPIKYSGNRDLDDLKKFMAKHAVKSFQKKDEL